MAYGISHSKAGFRIALALRLFHLRKFIAPPKGFIIDSMTFKYRRKITITEQSGNNLSDYQVRIDLDATNFDFSHFLNEGKDLRFTDASKNLLPYWVEKMDIAAEEATIWVKVPSIPANSSVEIFMYYGSESAPLGSSLDAFLFGDDFSAPEMKTAPSSGIWQPRTNMPAGRADLSCVVYNGKIYVFGGYGAGSSDPNADVFVYDPATDEWTSKTPMPCERWGHMVLGYNNKAYVFGGVDAAGSEIAEIDVYNLENDSWSTLDVLIPPELRDQGLVGVVFNDKFYLFLFKCCYEFDPATETFTKKSSSSYSITWCTPAVVGNKIYLLGGYDTGLDDATDRVRVYDPLNDAWDDAYDTAPYAAYGMPRENPVDSNDNQIYYCYGQGPRGTYHAKCYKYDLATKTWTELAGGKYPRDGVAGAIIDDAFYVIGGRAGHIGLFYIEAFYKPGINYPELSSSKWSVNAIGEMYYAPVGNKLLILDAYKSGNNYWIYGNTDAGNQHQAVFSPPSNFAVRWKQKVWDELQAEAMGQLGVALVGADDLISAYAVVEDDQGSAISLRKNAFIESSSATATSLTSPDERIYEIRVIGSDVKIFDETENAVVLTGSSTDIAKIAIAVGAYGGYPWLDEAIIDFVIVRKYAEPEPSVSLGVGEAA